MKKLNHLLIIPRFVDRIGEWYIFPLGIAYISSCLKKEGFNVFTLNLNSEEGSIYDILKREIEKNDIDIVATGGLSFQYNAINIIVETAKKIKKNLITIVGGGIITSAPEASMQALKYVDYGVIGEGEITICELSHAIEETNGIDKVRGIIYKEKDDCFITSPREEVKDLDSIPYPDYEGFDFKKIMSVAPSMHGINEMNAITMISSRSCPYRCTFCFHSSGNRFRQRSLDNFFYELDYLVSEYGVKYIFIADELFAYDMKRVKEFCQRIKQYDIKWWAQFRVSEITPGLVKLLKDSNCVTIGFGIESADNRILKSMKKGITIEQTEKALKLVYEAGITIQGGFIFGDKEETLETATNTLNWWKEHAHYGLSLNFITAFPGTEIYQYARNKGIIEDEVEFIKQGCPTVNLSKMSKEERNWLSEKIFFLLQTELKEPGNMTGIKIDYFDGKISLDGNCLYCGINNHWESIRFFTRNTLTCSNCGKKHKVPIIKEITREIDKNIKIILKKYDKIAFWGINDYFFDLTKYLKEVSVDRVYYVDISKMKQGVMVNDKMVHSPEIIADQDVKFVIIPVISLVTTIEQQIKKDYKNVERIVSILDLFKPMDTELIE